MCDFFDSWPDYWASWNVLSPVLAKCIDYSEPLERYSSCLPEAEVQVWIDGGVLVRPKSTSNWSLLRADLCLPLPRRHVPTKRPYLDLVALLKDVNSIDSISDIMNDPCPGDWYSCEDKEILSPTDFPGWRGSCEDGGHFPVLFKRWASSHPQP